MPDARDSTRSPSRSSGTRSPRPPTRWRSMIMRSAYSPVVRDTMDYSTALCDRHGRVVAQGLTLAVQLGTFPTVMRLRARRVRRRPQPGDIYIANDPYGYGGQHLPDIYVIKPIFVDGAARGLGGDDGAPHRRRRHRARAASPSTRPRSTGGLRMPLLKLFDRASRTRRFPHHRGEHAAAGAGARRSAGAGRGLPRRRARAHASSSSATARMRHAYMDELQRPPSA